MTPIITGRGRQQPRALTPEERNYNRHFFSERNIIERCIGVTKMRFRCILGERRLRYTPRKVARFFYCCATLHNWLILNNFDILHGIDERELNELIQARVDHERQEANQFAAGNIQIPNPPQQQREAQRRRLHLINVLNALPR